MNQPNFFVAGAPKSGTTSLYHYLDQHPEIYMSPIKEPNYFASEIRLDRFSERLRPRAERDAHSLREYLEGPMREKRFGGIVTGWDDYLKLFRDATDQKAVGEASVSYLWSQSAAGNIRRVIPNARIIAVLRNPAEMLFSMYLHSVRSGAAPRTFREAIEQGLEQPDAGIIDVLHPFLEFGLYHEQISRLLQHFPQDQVRVFWYEQYQTEPARMLSDIFRFLNVDPDFHPDMSKRYLEGNAPNKTLDPADRACLVNFYQDDISKLSTLLDHDLSGWLR